MLNKVQQIYQVMQDKNDKITWKNYYHDLTEVEMQYTRITLGSDLMYYTMQ